MPLDAFGCDIASGRLDRDGYAFHGKTRAHIVAWVRARGPVPTGKVLDHLCRNRACRSWWHLEPVTQSENELRKSWARRARRERCPFGHAMAENRVVTSAMGIVCRECNREHGGMR